MGFAQKICRQFDQSYQAQTKIKAGIQCVLIQIIIGQQRRAHSWPIIWGEDVPFSAIPSLAMRG
jgi:hypothetical protein